MALQRNQANYVDGEQVYKSIPEQLHILSSRPIPFSNPRRLFTSSPRLARPETPPNLNKRPQSWSTNGPRMLTIGIIAVCSTFCALSAYAAFLKTQGGSPALLDYLKQNFVCSRDNWRAGRWWTILTASVMHESLLHLGVNMYCLWSFGPASIALFGVGGFAALWLVSAVAGAGLLFSVQEAKLARIGGGAGEKKKADEERRDRNTLSARVAKWWTSLRPDNEFGFPTQQPSTAEERLYAGAVGASTAICGLVAATALARPCASVQVMLIPVAVPITSALAVGAVFSAYCIYNTRVLPGIGHEGHLGGLLGGGATYYVFLRPWLRRLGRI